MNFSTVILDLNMSIVGVNTQLDFRLLVLGKKLSRDDPDFYGKTQFVAQISSYMDYAHLPTRPQMESVICTPKVDIKEHDQEVQELSSVSQSSGAGEGLKSNIACHSVDLVDSQEEVIQIARQL
ncbi:hypothetical protein C0993_002542 [Termitomyces sp. T159_Od127]|nr:hypothetical protein C0993_002542 [Termitomyces sp. T159_Od127]